MDFDFSEIDPEMEKIHFQKRYNHLLEKMYEFYPSQTFEKYLKGFEKESKKALLSDYSIRSYGKQSALINLKAIHTIEKEYQLLKVIDQ